MTPIRTGLCSVTFRQLTADAVIDAAAGTLVRSWTDPAARGMSDHLPVIAEVRVVTK